MTSQLPAGERYDAFISYASASSGRHARQINRALFRLGRRHLKGRSLNVFLDVTSLKAGDLGRNIENALERSNALLVLLDRTTKDSPWVTRELEHWFTHGGGHDRTFLVRTDPELDLTWDEQARGYRSPEGLPVPLRTAFETDQKYFDVFRSRTVDEATLAGLYAAMMDIEPAQLLLQEARHQRQRRRRFTGVTTVLVGLLVAAVVAGLFAAQRGNEARAEATSANALLTLPYSQTQAIEQVLDASLLVDSQSVRSAMIAIAGETSSLRRTLDWTTTGVTRRPTGMSLTAAGEGVVAWGASDDKQGVARCVVGCGKR